MKHQLDIKDVITIAISLIFILIQFYFFIVTSPEEIKIQTYLIFMGTLLILIVSIFIIYIYSRWINLIKGIKNNTKQITNIQRNINLKDLFNNIDKRLIILEMFNKKKKNKKAQIDPRIIIWIVLIILFILFLKSIEVF